jgi:Cys-tRNA(Pro)/Cys-tRNA(Cys) deacylase
MCPQDRIRNNITRMLDAQNIHYTPYELPAEKISALEAAEIMEVPPQEVFKTIVVKRLRRGKAILAMVPGPNEVDLKRLAKALGEKKLVLATRREAEQLTGLQVGGISPLALINKGFQMVLDASAEDYEDIYISGGQRGLDIHLPVRDLTRLTKAKIAPISLMYQPDGL